MAWSARRFFGKTKPAERAEISRRLAKGMRLQESQLDAFTIVHEAVKTPQSSWVVSFAYGMRNSDMKAGLIVQFKSGATCFYPGTSDELYHDMKWASSKGVWVHDNIFENDYELI